MSNFPYHETILKRFLRYAVVNTMSDPHVSDKRPTTDGQLELLEMLAKEVKELGISDVTFDHKGYVVARIPSNVDKEVTPIGFMAHVDTADDVWGNDVKPRVVTDYDGGVIILNDQYVLDPSHNSDLTHQVGSTIVVTDGTTLLGADDKSGVAIIMSLAEYLMSHDEVKHGIVELIFTSDEETGGGMDAFDLSLIKAKVCYTIDGNGGGEIEGECFNAASVKVEFTGVPYHLGAARGRLVNSVSMAATFMNAIPRSESPEATDGRYGYYSVDDIKGTIVHTSLLYYVRDFDINRLNERIETLKSVGQTVEKLFPGGKVTLSSHFSYANMADKIKEQPEVMESIFASAKIIHLPLEEKIIRGGTDGSRLTSLGIPTPNIFTGGHNIHSRYEWLSISQAVDAARLVEEIVHYWVK
ncbi:MAG: peptidase T [Spirochaetia bacterium]|nr:peptidase T [Spirochaetia bacterium]